MPSAYLIREVQTFEVVSDLTGEIVSVHETRADAQKVIDRLTDASDQVLAHIKFVMFGVRQ